MIIELPFPISANRYWRHTRHGTIYVSAEARSYRESIRALCYAAGLEPITGPVDLRVHAYMPQKNRDLDNTLKVLCDGLQGALFCDDSQIYHIDITRHAATRKTACVTVEVTTYEPARRADPLFLPATDRPVDPGTDPGRSQP